MNAVRSWEDENSLGRCTATHVAPSDEGDVTVRCDGQVGHAGPVHQGHVGRHPVQWRDEAPGDDTAATQTPAVEAPAAKASGGGSA